MYRATTPKQEFTFPVEIENFSEIQITYSQRKLQVLTKNLDDMTIENEFTVSFFLTQDETRKFIANVPIYVQIRAVGAVDGNVIASTIFEIPCDRVLNESTLRNSVELEDD